jgi:hypothetical protein
VKKSATEKIQYHVFLSLAVCPGDYPYYGPESKYADYYMCWKTSSASLDDDSCLNWCIPQENVAIDEVGSNHLANCPNNICPSTC